METCFFVEYVCIPKNTLSGKQYKVTCNKWRLCNVETGMKKIIELKIGLIFIVPVYVIPWYFITEIYLRMIILNTQQERVKLYSQNCIYVCFFLMEHGGL